MNISKFTVLGALENLDTGSGYDILTYLEIRKIDKWTEVKKGSVYFAIKQLLKENAIEMISEIKDSAYPTRTIYQMTTHGHDMFDLMQEEAFMGLFPNFYGFKMALKFNSRKTSDEIILWSHRAIKKIDMILEGMNQYIKNEMQDKEFQFFIEHDQMLYQQEKKWIQMVIAKHEKKQRN